MEEVAVSGEDGGGVFVESLFVGLKRFHELVEVRRGWTGIVGICINGSRFGVRLALDLLFSTISLRFDFKKIPIFSTDDFRGFSSAFGAESVGDLHPLGCHSAVDLTNDIGFVIDALEANINQFDAPCLDLGLSGIKDLLG